MIQNRINFIETQLNTKKQQHEIVTKERDGFLEEVKKITVDMLDEGLLEELNGLNLKIDELNLEKGKILKSTEILVDTEKMIETLKKDIELITTQMSSENINEKIKKFNSFFASYSEKLYGEKYIFAYNSKWKQQKNGFPVTLADFNGKVGTGKKKGVIVAFDFAYMQYAEKLDIKAPRFVIHDKLENTHINQLRTIFSLCQELSGEYIVPILRERVDKVDREIIDQAKILELNKEDMFFRVK